MHYITLSHSHTNHTLSLSLRIYIPLFFILLFLCSHFSFCSPQSPEREWVQSHRLLLRQGIHLNRLHHSFDAKYVSFCSLIQRFFFFFLQSRMFILRFVQQYYSLFFNLCDIATYLIKIISGCFCIWLFIFVLPDLYWMRCSGLWRFVVLVMRMAYHSSDLLDLRSSIFLNCTFTYLF